MRVGWIRGGERIDFSRPNVFLTLGTRGSGKSSLLEHLAELYLREGQVILDLFGSRDGEGLAWLRSPWVNDRKVLLICGDNADLVCSYPFKRVSQIRLSDLENNDILISASPLYSSPSDEFVQVNQLINLLYKRLHWRRLVNIIVREAANLFYSRLKVSDNQVAAKSDATYLIRESRHMGLSMSIDTLKFTSVDSDIRNVSDYIILKSQGVTGLPDDLNFLYGFIEPHIFRKMPLGNFVIMSRQGSIGVGAFEEVKWHKQEREDLLHSLDIRIEHGEELKHGEDKGTFKTIGDMEHAEILRLYMGDRLGMAKIGTLKDRSSATIKSQIDQHNQAIQRVGFCSVCKRAGGQFYRDQAARLI
jgi:energy-coupling factor transporter ATP-binding protein EcfA2